MKFVLDSHFLYNLFKIIIGGKRSRSILIQEYIKPDKNKNILDLCCGPSDILPFLEFSEYTGVDFSRKYINYCNKKYYKIRNASFILKDVNKFLESPIPQKKYDIILFLGGMHHIDDKNLSKTLQNIKKCLTSDGRLITFDGCFEPHLSQITKTILANDRGQFVRTKKAWVEIFTSVFMDYKFDIRTDLLRIPYNHIIFYK